ncbi:MAG: hypothetical protein NZ954_08270 [Thermofilaceae archaeon]|nr:hypothetical protein [Thermofilaceae archaeon]MDW8004912.1 hypothetical protein [Thermofilaceae archaeon]
MLLKALKFALAVQQARKKGLLLGIVVKKTGVIDVAILDRVGDLVIYRGTKAPCAWKLGTVYSLAGAQCVIAHEAAAATLDEDAFKAAGGYGDLIEAEKNVNEHLKLYWRFRQCQRCGALVEEVMHCGVETVETSPPTFTIRTLDDLVSAATFIEQVGLPPVTLRTQPVTLRSDVLSRVSRFTSTELAALAVTSFAALSKHVEGARRTMLMARINFKLILLLLLVGAVALGLMMILPQAARVMVP